MAKFIVNQNSGVHNLENTDAAPKGARPATDTEIAGWYEAQKLPVPSEYTPFAEHGEGENTENGLPPGPKGRVKGDA